MGPITSNGVGRVNTVRWFGWVLLSGVDLRDIRRERLLKFAKARGVQNDPSGLGMLIGKKPNQVYNLLHGSGASFGEKVARSIEATAGLPLGYLDIDDNSARPSPWPFPRVDIARILALAPDDRAYVEGHLEAAIKACELRAVSESLKGNSTQAPVTGEDIPSSPKYPEMSTDELRQELERKTGFGSSQGRKNAASKAGRVQGERRDRGR